MENLVFAIGHNKGGIIGTVLSCTLGFIGKATLSDTAFIMAIFSGAVTALYTLWKWYTEFKKIRSKNKNKHHEEPV